MKPKAKRNGVYGYRAFVEFEDGRRSLSVIKTIFPAKYLAEKASQEWIDKNKDNPVYRDEPPKIPIDSPPTIPTDPSPLTPLE